METQIYNLICQKCGKEYSLELTESQFLKANIGIFVQEVVQILVNIQKKLNRKYHKV